MLRKLIESVDVNPTSRYAELLRLADQEALLSPDPSTKVGAVLVVDPKRWRLVRANDTSQAHNNFSSIKDVEQATREQRYEDVIHAEENLIIRAGHKMSGGTVFSTHEPCGHCWRLLVKCEVKKVVFRHTDEERRERWNCEAGRTVALLAKIEIDELYP
jgi:deoxycytidylate deaminase